MALVSDSLTKRTLTVAPFAISFLAAACLTPPPARPTPGRVEADSSSSGGPVASTPYEWKSVVITGGGFVTGVVFSPVAPGIAYARTDVGGAYRYDSKARSWLPITDFIGHDDANYKGIESFAADPVRADRIYMAVGMYTQSWAGMGAFMRSDDRGDTWRVAESRMKMGGNELSRSAGERLAVDPNQPRVLYFGSRRDGLWRSEDEAETWQKVESFPVPGDKAKGLGLPFVLFDPTSGKRGEETPAVYVGVSQTSASLHRSLDAGESWEPVPNQPRGFVPHRAAFDREGTLYLSYGLGESPYALRDGAVYRFEPKLEKWTDITPRKPTKEDRFGYGGIAVDPLKPGALLAATMDRWTKGAEIFRSVDRGASWMPLAPAAVLDGGGVQHREELKVPQWMGDIKIDPFDSSRAMVVEGGGVWMTEDLDAADSEKPTHWSFHSRNLEETCTRELVSPPEGPLLLTAQLDTCGFRHDKLNAPPKRGNFENPTCASADDIDFAGQTPNVVVRVGSYPWDGSQSPRGAMSTDGGATWEQFASEPKGSDGSGSVTVSADGAVVVWAPRGGRVAYSRDGGNTWALSAGLPGPSKVPDWAVWPMQLAADRVNPKKLYAFDALAGMVYASEDAGATFVATARNLRAVPDYELHFVNVRTVPGHEGHLWITTKEALARSIDSGKRFKMVSGVEEAHAVGFGRSAPGSSYPAVYLSGMVNGVTGFFRSDDEARSFVRINDDQHQYGGAQLIVGDPRVYGRVYVAPGGRGIIYGDPKAE